MTTQTKRTLTVALDALDDNTTQQISPEDLRDAIITIAPDFGAMYIVASAATTVSDTTSFFPAAGTYALISGSDWDMNTNGQLRYTGAAARSGVILASASLTSVSNNQVIEFGLAKNGTVISTSVIQRKINTGSDVGAVAAFAFTTASAGDYFTLVVRNTTSASDVTFTKAQVGGIGFAQ